MHSKNLFASLLSYKHLEELPDEGRFAIPCILQKGSTSFPITLQIILDSFLGIWAIVCSRGFKNLSSGCNLQERW